MPGQSRVAIVSGGAGSIGSEICRTLAARGYRICLSDLGEDRVAAAVTALGSSHHGVAGDVSDEETVVALIDRARSLGEPTILVNAAGISPKSPAGKKEIGEISAAEFRRVLEINTVAPFLLAKHVSTVMPRDGSASIINILSITVRLASGGPRGSTFPPIISSAAHYGASKAALHNLQASLCRELAGLRIRVNGVSPGFIATDINAAISADERAQVLSQIPLGRAGTPADVAGVVAFLAGPEASYLSGAVIDVNGGWLPA